MRFFIGKKLFVRIIILVIVLLISLYVLIDRTDIHNTDIDWLAIVLLTVNMVFSIWNLIIETKKRAFSFSLVFWMFNFLFFGLSPIIQYLSGWGAWGLQLDNDTYVTCATYVFAWMLCYKIGSVIKRKRKSIEKSSDKSLEYAYQKALIVQILCVLYLFVTLGARLFFRGAQSESTIMDSSLSLINHHVLRNLVYYLTVIQIGHYKRTGDGLLQLCISLVLFIIGCFPLGISRYMVGAYYLGIILLLVGKEKWKGWFSIFFVFAILIVFPLSNMFRFSKTFLDWNSIVSSAQSIMRGTYNTGNYDAFHMLSAGVKDTSINGFSWGYQMLGALFFFIPRSIWKSKPEGTGGTVIIRINNTAFSNVSMPLVGEAYVNFGLIGIVLFGIIVGYLCKKYDKEYWNDSFECKSISFIYPTALMYFFFLNRGDMLSAGSYMIANIVVGLAVRRLFIIDKKLKENSLNNSDLSWH